MKKIVFTMGAFIALSGAMAQGVYGSFSVGYAGGTAKDVIGTSYDVTSATTFTRKNIEGTFGSGVPVSLGFGYMFSDHFGMELGFNYFSGFEVMSDETTTFFGDFSKTTSKGYQIRILPQLVVSSGTDNAVGVYAKAGMVLPVSGKTTFKVDAMSSTVPVVVEGESAGSFSYGFTGAFGVSYGLSDKLSLFGELQGLNLRIKGASQTITSYTAGGVDIMSFLDKEDIETTYVNELTATSNTDINTPTQELAKTTNYSSFGINIGVKFNF